jgi:hypothetical protein
MGKSEIFKNANKVATEVNQVVYTVFGSTTATSESHPPVELNTGLLGDVSHFAGTEIIYTAGPDGAAWVAVNPIPENKCYQTQLVPGGSLIDVTADGTECAVVCLSGGVTVGERVIAPLNYARILSGRTATLEVPQNSSALILKIA